MQPQIQPQEVANAGYLAETLNMLAETISEIKKQNLKKGKKKIFFVSYVSPNDRLRIPPTFQRWSH